MTTSDDHSVNVDGTSFFKSLVVHLIGFQMQYESNPYLQKLKELIEPVFTHAIAMCAAILCIWAIDLLLRVTLGEHAKLFGLMPLVYVAHVGDVIAIGRFFWKMLKEF